ncbi:MAG TPA: NUDIX domain-containing protein, partial [Gammaproteobacteria bacterium]
MNPKLHLTVATIVEHNNEFLLVEEIVGDSLVINQPAGHVENGESLVEAAIRETYEETGSRVEIESLISMYRWQHPDNGETFFRVAFCGKL